MAKVKQSMDFFSFLTILGRLTGIVVFHAVIYVCSKKFMVWWRARKNNPDPAKNNWDINETLTGTKKSKVGAAVQKNNSGNTTTEADEYYNSESDPEVLDIEMFMNDMDRFCRMGTKIRKSKKSLQYIRAIQKREGNNKTKNSS